MAKHRRRVRLTDRWSRVPGAYKVALGFAGVALLAGVVTAFERDRTRVLDERGRRTTATVIGVDRWTKGGPLAEVRFRTDDGQDVVTNLQEFAWRAERGREVTVEYASDDPSYYVRDPDAAGTELRFYGRVTAILGAVAVLILLLRRPVLQLQARRDRSTGQAGPPERPRYRTHVDAEGRARSERVG